MTYVSKNFHSSLDNSVSPKLALRRSISASSHFNSDSTSGNRAFSLSLFSLKAAAVFINARLLRDHSLTSSLSLNRSKLV
jgi:hypothetical protein